MAIYFRLLQNAEHIRKNEIPQELFDRIENEFPPGTINVQPYKR